MRLMVHTNPRPQISIIPWIPPAATPVPFWTEQSTQPCSFSVVESGTEFPSSPWDSTEDLKSEDTGSADAEGDPETAEKTGILRRVRAVTLNVGHRVGKDVRLD